MKMLNNKEAKLALAIGAHLKVQNTDRGEAAEVWAENGEYYTFLTAGQKWLVTSFVKIWLEDPTQMWCLDCPQGKVGD